MKNFFSAITAAPSVAIPLIFDNFVFKNHLRNRISLMLSAVAPSSNFLTPSKHDLGSN